MLNDSYLEELPMEKRLGTMIILIEDKSCVEILNNTISQNSSIILSRHGITLQDRNQSVMSLVIEGSTEQISILSGKLGKIKGLKSRSVLIKNDI
jgi:putative iron-only hydrogenase system regulator